MKIENPLMTGTTLEALAFQATMLKGTGIKLGIESATGADKQKVLNPFLGYVSRVKNFAVDKLSAIKSLKGFEYAENYATLDRISKLNYGNIRSMVLPAIPDTNAKMHDYLQYLDEMSKVVNNVINQTIPGCKQYFSLLLEDVTALTSASQASAIDRLTTNQFSLEKLNERFPGIIRQADNASARAPMSAQYDSMKDFIECQDHLGAIANFSSKIKVEEASHQVNEMNEIISRVIMKAKQKEGLEMDSAAVSAISTYLYTLADEIALIPAFVIQLTAAKTVLQAQVLEIKETLAI